MALKIQQTDSLLPPPVTTSEQGLLKWEWQCSGWLYSLSGGQWWSGQWSGQKEDDPFRIVEECEECLYSKILVGTGAGCSTVTGHDFHNTDWEMIRLIKIKSSGLEGQQSHPH